MPGLATSMYLKYTHDIYHVPQIVTSFQGRLTFKDGFQNLFLWDSSGFYDTETAGDPSAL